MKKYLLFILTLCLFSPYIANAENEFGYISLNESAKEGIVFKKYKQIFDYHAPDGEIIEDICEKRGDSPAVSESRETINKMLGTMNRVLNASEGMLFACNIYLFSRYGGDSIIKEDSINLYLLVDSKINKAYSGKIVFAYNPDNHFILNDSTLKLIRDITKKIHELNAIYNGKSEIVLSKLRIKEDTILELTLVNDLHDSGFIDLESFSIRIDNKKTDLDIIDELSWYVKLAKRVDENTESKTFPVIFISPKDEVFMQSLFYVMTPIVKRENLNQNKGFGMWASRYLNRALSSAMSTVIDEVKTDEENAMRALTWRSLLEPDTKPTKSGGEVVTASYISDEISCYRYESGATIAQMSEINEYVERYFTELEEKEKGK